MHRRHGIRVVDATAGLGRDALVLAHLGCEVLALEKEPVLCALLHQAALDLGARIEVRLTESVAWLAGQEAAAAPEVVYLDPMFEEQSRAQVKKEMQACRALTDPGDDPTELLAAARLAATDRVVVKRHPHLHAIAPDVSHVVGSDRVRFDVYLAKP